MRSKSRRFAAVDILLIVMMIVPILFAIVLKVLTTPLSEGISITGAQIYFTVPMPLQDLPITSAQINSWAVIVSVLALCLYMTHGLTVKGETKRQYIAEWIVEKSESLVMDSMGEFFAGYAPFIAAIIALSAFSSLLSLLGLFPPTSDINIVGGWAILVFILITYYKLKDGVGNYLKSFTEPIFIMTPMNVISEIASPLSLAFRHFGNVAGGGVLTTLIYAALALLSNAVLGWIPGFVGTLPIFQAGIPAILSIYFDLFSGFVQAFVFCLLTMVYIAGASPAPEELPEDRRAILEAREAKKKLRQAK